MKPMNSKPDKSRALLFCLLVVAVCAIFTQAQSGRRQPKAPPAAPVPTPTPEPTPEPKKEKASELGFLIAADNSSAFEVYPLSYYDAAMRGCADRLRSGSSASVNVTQSNMNRGEAIKKAKGETTTYVVLMRLVLDQMYAKSYDDLEIDFAVFAPKTGKVVVFGKSYQNINRKGPIIVGPTSRGSSGALYREQLLRFAGEDAANRILKTLGLDVVVPKSSAN
jgi:hypothetical protein